MKSSTALLKAWKLFRGGRGWIKDDWRRFNDKGRASYCAIGALWEIDIEDTDPIEKHLAAAGVADLVSFNDAPTTTYGDVSRAFRRAAALARAAGD